MLNKLLSNLQKSNKLLIFFFLVAILMEFVWIFNSDGFYFIDDGCHFNYNRHYLEDLSRTVSSWSRVGRVLLYFPAAQFGLKGVQINAAIIFFITIIISYKILKNAGITYAEWVVPFIAFQPVLFNISFSSLAELPAATLIILSFYFYQRNKDTFAMLCASLTFIFRTEMYFVAVIYLLVYLKQKKYKTLIPFLVGPLFWTLYTIIITGSLHSLLENLFIHTKLPRITQGVKWYHYLVLSPKTYGLFQTLFFITGCIYILFKKELKSFIILMFIVFGGIAGHTLAALDGLNTTCSVGQVRYISIVGPAFAVISVAGMSYFATKINRITRNIFAVIIFIVSLILGPLVTPFHKKYEIDKISEQFAYQIHTQYQGYVIISDLHQIANALDEPSSGGKIYKPLTKKNLEEHQKALIIWESSLDGSPFTQESLTRKDIENLPGVRVIDSINVVINHNYDFPIYHLKERSPEFIQEIFNYYMKEQNCWENIFLKVYLKNS